MDVPQWWQLKALDYLNGEAEGQEIRDRNK